MPTYAALIGHRPLCGQNPACKPNTHEEIEWNTAQAHVADQTPVYLLARLAVHNPVHSPAHQCQPFVGQMQIGPG